MAFRHKTESELVSLRYVSDILKQLFTTGITDTYISDWENNGPDIDFTGCTTDGNVFIGGVEVKRCKGEYSPERYSFTSTPSANTAFEINLFSANTLSQEDIASNITNDVPEYLQGKHIYMLNASMNLKDGSQSFTGKYKWKEMLQDDVKHYLVYLWKNKILLFSPEQLNEAFEGYYWYNTTYVNQSNAVYMRNGSGWQRKAMLNLDKATEIDIEMPENLYREIFIPLKDNVNRNN